MTTPELVELFFAIAPPGVILEVGAVVEARTNLGHAMGPRRAWPVWRVESAAGVRFEVTCGCCQTCVLVTQAQVRALLAGDRDLLRFIADWFARLGHAAEVLR